VKSESGSFLLPLGTGHWPLDLNFIGEKMREAIELVAQGIEALAVLVIVGGIVYGVVRYFLDIRLEVSGAYKRFKDRIGNPLLLGLEFLVAADIIQTVALNRTLQSVAVESERWLVARGEWSGNSHP